MKIKFEFTGETDLSRRLVALAEMPGVDLALDAAAGQSLKSAQEALIRSGRKEVAASLQISTPESGVRTLSTSHRDAWYAEYGTRKKPAARWRQVAAKTGGAQLTSAIGDVVRRAVSGLSLRKS